MSSIYEFVKKQRDDYRSNTVEIVDGYDFSQYETLRTIELYHNSRFLTSNKDELEREKPFYNICKFRVNVATRATDLDTKDVHIESERATPKAYAASFILNLKNRNWMKKAQLGVFLNKLTHTRAKYGGVLVKKIERDNELQLHVMQWLNMITDQVDIRSGVKIELHYYTPADLKTQAPSNWKNIDNAIAAAKKSREAQASDNTTQKNKTPGAYIKVYEVHGVLPTCFLAGTSDKYPQNYGSEEEYERQMHVIVLDESNKDSVEGVTLFAGIEDEDPYKYLPYEGVDGRGLGVGVIEDLFEAQVWTNDSVKKKKDILELAGKILFQTSDSNIAAKNVLTDIENGHIFTTAPNSSITQVNNVPASLPAFDQLIEEWNTQAERVSSTYGAITGETMPAGTPFRQVAILNQEAGSLFDYRRQEAGLFIQELYLDWILPFLVAQVKKDKELTATLEPDELELVSESLANNEALKFAKEQLLSGKPVAQNDIEAIKQSARQMHTKSARKAFKDFSDLFENYEALVDVVTTGEQKNKSVILETLDSITKFIVGMQLPDGRNLALEDGPLREAFLQIVEATGVISPINFPKTQKPTPPLQNAAALPGQLDKPVPVAA